MPYGIVLSDSITDSSGGVLAPSSSVFRNRIINGDMRIAQRGTTSFSNGSGVTANFPVDRFTIYGSQASKFTGQQNAGSVTPPSGFTNYLGCTSSSAYAVLSSDYFWLYQRIEGFNTADFSWGTAQAATVTLSFWVRSSLTGTFGGSITNSAANRSYPFTYTINSANTWEKETITIAGDTTGTWATNNTSGVEIYFNLGAGSTFSGTAGAWAAGQFYAPTGATSVVGTNGATFYITGVQLEKGTTATSFDYRPYGTELALCQRYYQFIGGNTGDLNSITLRSYTTSGSFVGNQYMFPVQMRTSPTMTVSGTFVVTNCGQPAALGADGKTFSFQTQASATGAMVLYSNNSGLMTFAAEL